MGITQLQRAKKFLDIMKRKHGNFIKLEDFLDGLRFYISLDKIRIQQPYFELMKNFKLIKETENGIEIVE